MKKYTNLLGMCVFAVAMFAFVGVAQAVNFSQTNVYLAPGQSTTVYANNNYSSLYISGTPNSTVANVYLSGNTLNINANSIGNTSATICENSGYNNCTTIYINVSGNYYNGYNNYNNYNYNNGYCYPGYTTGGYTVYGNCNNGYYNNNYNYNNGYYYNGYTTGGGLQLIISNLSLPLGGSITVSSPNINTGGVYVANNPNSNIVSVSYVAGNNYNYYNNNYYYNNYSNYNYYNGVDNSVVIKGLSRGTGMITLCQNSNYSACSTISVNVY